MAMTKEVSSRTAPREGPGQGDLRQGPDAAVSGRDYHSLNYVGNIAQHIEQNREQVLFGAFIVLLCV